MLICEFEQRTGIYVTQELYAEIEKTYNEDSSIDKDEFCRRYKENVNELAAKIQYEADRKAWNKEREQREEIAQKSLEIQSLKKQIESLNNKIAELEGWEPYECSNMTEDSYMELKKHATRVPDIQKVAEWIEEKFGFKKEDIIVFGKIPIYIKSKKGVIRKAGAKERFPLYSATDHNYVRFDVKNWQYEVVNGELYLYKD